MLLQQLHRMELQVVHFLSKKRKKEEKTRRLQVGKNDEWIMIQARLGREKSSLESSN